MNQVYTALKDLGLVEQQITTNGYQIYSSTQVLNRGTDQENYHHLSCEQSGQYKHKI